MNRFVVLDSLRGVCACMIVLLHFTTQGLIYNSQFVTHGFLFVDFFFVLSGFVIAASYQDRLSKGYSPAAFMLLRTGRVYPLHLAMLIIFFIFELAFFFLAPESAARKPFSDGYNLILFLGNIFLIQIFVGSDIANWNGPSWSIAAEIWTYLVFSVLFRFTRRWLLPLALAISIGACVYLGFLTDRYLAVFHHGAFARCLYGFSLGVIAFSIHRQITKKFEKWNSAFIWTSFELLAVFAVYFSVYFAGATVFSLLIPPLFFMVILLFAQERGEISRILSYRAFLFLGSLSYSIYMIHWFLELRFINLLSTLGHVLHRELVISVGGHNQVGISPLFGDAMSLTMLAIVIAGATLSYRWIEKPMQKWSRARVAERFQQPVTKPENVAPTF